MLIVIGGGLAVFLMWRAYRRLQLSLAKHPSLTGHSKISRRLSRRVPAYSFTDAQAFSCDRAPSNVVDKRQRAFYDLAEQLRAETHESQALGAELSGCISDLNFTARYRVPYQFGDIVRQSMPDQLFVQESEGVRVRDADGAWREDLSGSYGVNLFGYDFYKNCMSAAQKRVESLGPVLGPYHPVVVENALKLKAISKLDEVSFHMSGTEAVMQAVRLARYHTGRRKIVTFCGAYHGWWDDVQPGVGNPVGTSNTLTLRDMDERALGVLKHRRDVACVLVNPLQALHPNRPAPGDGTLLGNGRTAGYDKDAYVAWLQKLRDVCANRGIALIMDEVFLGFRLGLGGAQEYFGVQADLVTYGKTLGGGLPVGVLCGASEWMQRFKEDQPANICFARGTFNAHPLVMASMNEFLTRLDDPAIVKMYTNVDELWDARTKLINDRFEANDLPIAVENMVSVWTFTYEIPSRFNWVFQFYLRAQGLILSWVGSGRLIFSHNYTDEEFEMVCDKIVTAALNMRAGGWWWQGDASPSIKRQLLGEALSAGRLNHQPAEIKVADVSTARGA